MTAKTRAPQPTRPAASGTAAGKQTTARLAEGDRVLAVKEGHALVPATRKTGALVATVQAVKFEDATGRQRKGRYHVQTDLGVAPNLSGSQTWMLAPAAEAPAEAQPAAEPVSNVVPIEQAAQARRDATKAKAAAKAAAKTTETPAEAPAQPAKKTTTRRGPAKTGDPQADRTLNAAKAQLADNVAKTAKAAEAAPTAAGTKGVEAFEALRTKGATTADGFVSVWVHGYYVLAKRQLGDARKFEWIAIMQDGSRVAGTSVASAEAQARAYGKAHGMVNGK